LANDMGEVGLVPDQQQPPFGLYARHRIERIRSVEPARQRQMDDKACLLIVPPAFAGQLGRLARPHLGAGQNLLEAQPEPCEGDARGACLLLAAHGQSPLEVLTASVRLGVCVTK
jgi:hypothetical protein